MKKRMLGILIVQMMTVGFGSAGIGCDSEPGADQCPEGEEDCGCDEEDGGIVDDEDTLSFLPSNLDLEELDLDGLPSDLVFDDSTCQGGSLNLDPGQASCASSSSSYRYQEVAQSNGSTVAVFAARNIRIEQGVSVRAFGALPIVLLALDELVIAGTLDGGALLSREGVAGGFDSPQISDSLHDGNGPGGGVSGDGDYGGGGGSYCGVGGAGGNGSSGGVPYGNPEISPLIGGSSGGNIFAGAGGGALQIVAGASIHIAPGGIVTVGGGAGDSGGGGSGGAVLLEAPQVIMDGTIAANGGGGGGFGTAQDGLASDQPAQGAVVPEHPDLAGGAGSAGDDIHGAHGLCNDVPCYIPGSGGGAAGRIRLNAEPGGASITGLLSPSLDAQCTTIGELDAAT